MKGTSIVPGRVLARKRRVSRLNVSTRNIEYVTETDLAMVIGFKAKVNRRHSRSLAKTSQYDVIVFWLTDKVNPRLQTVTIDVDPPSWSGEKWCAAF